MQPIFTVIIIILPPIAWHYRPDGQAPSEPDDRELQVSLSPLSVEMSHIALVTAPSAH
jgi:hypothetical protein